MARLWAMMADLSKSSAIGDLIKLLRSEVIEENADNEDAILMASIALYVIPLPSWQRRWALWCAKCVR